MFKVLNKETLQKEVVEKVNITKHLHISGREFTKEDAVEFVTKKKVEEVKELPKAKKSTKKTKS